MTRTTNVSSRSSRGVGTVVAALDADEAVAAADIEAAVAEAAGRYNTVCVGLSGRTEGSLTPLGTVIEHLVQEGSGNVAPIECVVGPGTNWIADLDRIAGADLGSKLATPM